MQGVGSQAPLGLVGLGNIGTAMLSRLLATGPVLAFDIDPARCAAAVEQGATIAQSATELARLCSTAILSLPRPEISRSVIQEFIAAPAKEGFLVIETSTITAEQAISMHKLAADFGYGYVDAAILSGVGEVADGSSCFLIGGIAADVDRALPVVQRVCSRYVVLGDAGAGMAAKVINNAVAHAVMVLLAEAAALARRSNISLDQLCEMLLQNDAGLKRPLTARLSGRYRDRNFEGGMPTEVARKDSALALEMARSLGVPLFTIPAADVVYELALAGGMARKDYAAIATLWETWCPPESPLS